LGETYVHAAKRRRAGPRQALTLRCHRGRPAAQLKFNVSAFGKRRDFEVGPKSLIIAKENRRDDHGALQKLGAVGI
jgi:hypothetical protein